MIYTVTCFEQCRDEHGPNGHRTWGWYRSAEKAREAILGNHTDMFEGRSYEWACIEEVPAGVIAECKAVEWFRARLTTDGMDIIVSECAEPEWAKGSVNWSMG